MVEETVWDDVEICDHSYDRRCHTSFTTTFEVHLLYILLATKPLEIAILEGG